MLWFSGAGRRVGSLTLKSINMIFRTLVMVLRAIPDELPGLNAVAYVFGINARDLSEATRMAAEAAKDAVDREGNYIGGVVIEADCRCSYPKEFSGYEKHFHKPIDERGIFYVSGVTYTGVFENTSAEAADELADLRKRISRLGLPTPSFVHPQMRDDPPTRVRLLCSVCGHWIEVSNAGLIYSFMDGLDMFSKEGEEARNAVGAAGPFMSRHLQDCCDGLPPNSLHIEGIQEDNPRWSMLDETKREDVNAE